MVSTRDRVAGVVLAGLLLCTAALARESRETNPKSPTGTTTSVVGSTTQATEECSDASTGSVEWVRCESARFTAIGERDGVPRALAAVQEAGQADPSRQAWCHDIEHAIGRWAYQRLKDIPALLEYNDRTCQFGYIHGAFEEFAATATDAEMRSTFPIACAALTNTRKVAGSERDWGECLHALGHAAAVHTSKDLVQALEWCRLAGSDKPTSDSCAGGVFMEYGNSYIKTKTGVEQTSAGDHGPGQSVISDDLIPVLCSKVAALYARECWNRIGSFWGPAGIPDAEMLKKCATDAGEYASKCAYSVGTWLMRAAYSNARDAVGVSKFIAAVCNTGASLAGPCFAGAVYPIVGNEIWTDLPTDEWMDLCDRAATTDAASFCRKSELGAIAALPDVAKRQKIAEARGFTAGELETALLPGAN